jgi:hypothetical protein
VKSFEVHQQKIDTELNVLLRCFRKKLLERCVQVVGEFTGEGFVVTERPANLCGQLRVSREMLWEKSGNTGSQF